ncbi:MAG: SpoIIE family protein phosphatase [Nocardioidaceae bacterium]|nr:SpoIIE family protein phosphatase [Nocardioidaceae bacterium]
MSVGLAGDAEEQLVFLRHLSTAMGEAFTADEVARATLATVLTLPHVVRAGIAIDTEGGRNLHFVSSDDATSAGRLQWCLIDTFADVPLVDAVRRDRDVYLPTGAEIARRYDGYGTRQRELGVKAVAALPLSTDAQRVGALLLTFDVEQVFDETTRRFLGLLGALVTPALRKGVAYQAQRSTAQQLQRNLMPRTLPRLDGLDLGSHYQAGGLHSDVGGDWYDVIELPGDVVAVAVGDVMGKGTDAAVVMGEVRSALRAYALIDPSPAFVLQRLDTLVSRHAVPEQLVTVAYGVIGPARDRITLALAGHPPPAVACGDDVHLLEEGGAALGVGAGPWPEQQVELAAGTTLLLYSDGLVEDRGRELGVGMLALVDEMRATPERRRQPRDLCARLADRMTGPFTDDDVTLLAVAAAPEQTSHTTSVTLPDDNLAPGVARRFLRGALTGWAVPEDTIDTAELCVSELVTNAVIHTGTASELSLKVVEDVLTVSVRDSGGADVVRAEALDDPLVISGRGLTLVDALTSAWAAERSADGTTVWFELDHAAPLAGRAAGAATTA